jgi:hypothetical protein
MLVISWLLTGRPLFIVIGVLFKRTICGLLVSLVFVVIKFEFLFLYVDCGIVNEQYEQCRYRHPRRAISHCRRPQRVKRTTR